MKGDLALRHLVHSRHFAAFQLGIRVLRLFQRLFQLGLHAADNGKTGGYIVQLCVYLGKAPGLHLARGVLQRLQALLRDIGKLPAAGQAGDIFFEFGELFGAHGEQGIHRTIYFLQGGVQGVIPGFGLLQPGLFSLERLLVRGERRLLAENGRELGAGGVHLCAGRGKLREAAVLLRLQGGLALIQLLLALVYLRAPVGKLTLGICQRLVHAGQHAAVQRVYFFLIHRHGHLLLYKARLAHTGHAVQPFEGGRDSARRQGLTLRARPCRPYRRWPPSRAACPGS